VALVALATLIWTGLTIGLFTITAHASRATAFYLLRSHASPFSALLISQVFFVAMISISVPRKAKQARLRKATAAPKRTYPLGLFLN
jgi:hypothetical protein